MILSDGSSTREISHKFDSPMAAYLYGIMLDGEAGDSEASDGQGNWLVQYGRRVLAGNDNGFVECHDYATADEAERAVLYTEERWHSVECEDCGQSFTFFYDDETCPACEEAQQRAETAHDGRVGWRGVAARVVADYGDDRLVIVLVGDDLRRWVAVDDVTPIGEDDYCGGCGQMGCTAERSDG